MELIKYLNSNFFTKKELLDISKISEQDFLKYQKDKIMPKHSYKLRLNLESDSFFGPHKSEQTVEYYAKGYSSWLAIIQSSGSTKEIYSVFANRYETAIENLIGKGHSSNDIKITSGLSNHIKQEWEHFLNGVYGLCTKSGLPEDIAAKSEELQETITNLEQKEERWLELSMKLED